MLKIAFCDDENQETRRLEALLEEYAADRGQDFAHTSYQSPVELMAEVEKGTRFDIILLDVLMPGENGMAAAREIREYDSNVKIIFLLQARSLRWNPTRWMHGITSSSPSGERTFSA